MDYRLELLDADTFEHLVNIICQKILGTGIVSFSKGRDLAKDGRFTGTAISFPSTNSPWTGNFIIQAKHTKKNNASCSDSDFKTQVSKEIKRLNELLKKSHIDNYILFTNRKYSGQNDEELRLKIVDETGIKNVQIIGKETLNDLYLNRYKEIVREFRLDLHHIPFSFSEDEMKKVIIAFREQLEKNKEKVHRKSQEIRYDFSHIEKTEKNNKNRLGEEYYHQHVLGESLHEFDKIDSFLSNPINEQIKDYYYDTAAELNQLITLKRDNFDAFEELFFYIYKYLCDGSEILAKSKRYVTTFLHYMYVECLIGKK